MHFDSLQNEMALESLQCNTGNIELTIWQIELDDLANST
jgi:hypothetical protein